MYGRSPAVEVKPRDTSTAAVRLEFVSDMTLRMHLDFFDSTGETEDLNTDSTSFTITATGGGISHSYTAFSWVSYGMTAFNILHYEDFDTCVPRTIKNFIEPGISYNFSVKASDTGWDKTYSGSSNCLIVNGENTVQVDLR